MDGERCEYGVESTVVKLVGNEVHVLREGSLLVPKLQVFLEDSMGNKCPKVVVAHKILSKETNM